MYYAPLLPYSSALYVCSSMTPVTRMAAYNVQMVGQGVKVRGQRGYPSHEWRRTTYKWWVRGSGGQGVPGSGVRGQGGRGQGSRLGVKVGSQGGTRLTVYNIQRLGRGVVGSWGHGVVGSWGRGVRRSGGRGVGVRGRVKNPYHATTIIHSSGGGHQHCSQRHASPVCASICAPACVCQHEVAGCCVHVGCNHCSTEVQTTMAHRQYKQASDTNKSLVVQISQWYKQASGSTNKPVTSKPVVKTSQ